MTNTREDPQYLTEYFSGIAKGDFYEEPVQGEYPDYYLKIKESKGYLTKFLTIIFRFH